MSAWIDSANGWAGSWAPVLWRASWQGGLFILAVWALCKAFPRIPAASRHWLWWLASAQLLIRLVVATPIALPLLPAHAPTNQVSIVTEVPVTTAMKPIADVSPVRVQPTAPPLTANPRPSVSLIVMSAWLLGLAVCLVNLLRRLVKTRSYLQGKSLFDHNELTDLVEELSAQIGVKPPTVRESRKAPCPLLVGWLRPTIVLPMGAIDSFTEVELKMAVAHELIHLKRRDLWLTLIPDTAQVLFFFHPLAWLAAHETAAAREEACDSEALRLSGGSLAAYARLLFNSAQSGSSAAVMGAAIGYRLIQRRINMLKSSTPGYGPITRRVMTGVIALAAVCALPWTVTAQSTAPAGSTNTVVHKVKSTKKHAGKNRVVHVLPKNAAKKHVQVTTKPTSSVVRVTPATLTGTARAYPSVALTRPTGPALSYTTPSRAPVLIIPAGSTAPANTATEVSEAANLTVGSTAASTPTPTSGSTKAVSTSAAPEVIAGNGRVSVDFDKVGLREAIKMTCREVRMDYLIRSDVADDTVTLSIHAGDPMDVIQAILKSVKQSLSAKRDENGVVHIAPATGN